MIHRMIGHMVRPSCLDRKHSTDCPTNTVNRVRNVAMKIAKTLNGDIDLLVVELAALFHDMAGKVPNAHQCWTPDLLLICSRLYVSTITPVYPIDPAS
jgi:hypothetical protein